MAVKEVQPGVSRPEGTAMSRLLIWFAEVAAGGPALLRWGYRFCEEAGGCRGACRETCREWTNRWVSLEELDGGGSGLMGTARGCRSAVVAHSLRRSGGKAGRQLEFVDVAAGSLSQCWEGMGMAAGTPCRKPLQEQWGWTGARLLLVFLGDRRAKSWQAQRQWLLDTRKLGSSLVRATGVIGSGGARWQGSWSMATPEQEVGGCTEAERPGNVRLGRASRKSFAHSSTFFLVCVSSFFVILPVVLHSLCIEKKALLNRQGVRIFLKISIDFALFYFRLSEFISPLTLRN